MRGGDVSGGDSGSDRRTLLPRALQKDSLVDFAWRMNERVSWENTEVSERLAALGGGILEICTFSGKGGLTLPRWSKTPIPPPLTTISKCHSSPPPSTRCETAALARLLYKIVELLSPNEHPDNRILQRIVPVLFFPETLPQLKVITAAGLLWTPTTFEKDTVTWTLSRQPPILSGNKSGPPPEVILSGEPGEASEWTLFDGRFYLRRLWLPEGNGQERQQQQKQEQRLKENEGNDNITSTHALHTPSTAPNKRPNRSLPTLRIRLLSKSELSKIKASLSADCYLFTTRQNVLKLLPPQQAEFFIGSAIASVPGVARFTIPVAEVVTGKAGVVVGLPSLGIWTSGLWGEGLGMGKDKGTSNTGSNIDSINTTTRGESKLPPPSKLSKLHNQLTGVNGLVECVLRGDGEYVSENAGLGKEWQVVWARPQHCGNSRVGSCPGLH